MISSGALNFKRYTSQTYTGPLEFPNHASHGLSQLPGHSGWTRTVQPRQMASGTSVKVNGWWLTPGLQERMIIPRVLWGTILVLVSIVICCFPDFGIYRCLVWSVFTLVPYVMISSLQCIYPNTRRCTLVHFLDFQVGTLKDANEMKAAEGFCSKIWINELAKIGAILRTTAFWRMFTANPRKANQTKQHDIKLQYVFL